MSIGDRRSQRGRLQAKRARRARTPPRAVAQLRSVGPEYEYTTQIREVLGSVGSASVASVPSIDP
eukprot:13759296-Alexandrium_andersonii.AAC.1